MITRVRLVDGPIFMGWDGSKLASPASHDGGGDYERNSDWGGAPPLVPESMGLGHADDEEDEVDAGLGRGEMSEF